MHLPWKRIFIFCIEIFFGINVVLVDIWVFSQTHPNPQSISNSSRNVPTPTPTPITIDRIVQPVQQSNQTQAAPSENTNTISIKEYFIPLGSGQTDATDWTDIPGALVSVDSASYKNSKKIVLEATVTIPNGNETAWVRLFNKTDGHPVWYSETSWSGGTTQFVTSSPITFDSGTKTYQVQVKNQLPSMSSVSNARIHIILQ